MNFFRIFNKTIQATRLQKPNNLLLRQSAPVYLSTSAEPSIDKLNSLKQFFQTINRLQAHKQNPKYKNLVLSQLKYLNANIQTQVSGCVKYVQNGGKLTAKGLSNMYACADKLGVNEKWVEIYLEQHIPKLLRFMNTKNMKDVQSGLKKYNGNPNFLELVNKQMSKNNSKPIFQYVVRAPHEIASFQSSEAKCSNNFLINLIQTNRSPVFYYANQLWRWNINLYNSLLKKQTSGYQLDG